jgi:hypothetical protein
MRSNTRTNALDQIFLQLLAACLMVARKNMIYCLAAILDLRGGAMLGEVRNGLVSASRQMARS